MKNEKGQQVFIDDVDILLTDKIVRHTKENADEKCAGTTEGAPLHSKNQTGKDIGRDLGMKTPKTGFLKCIIGGVLVIAGLIAFFLCKKKCRCGRKI
jgi:hypothetical protein